MHQKAAHQILSDAVAKARGEGHEAPDQGCAPERPAYHEIPKYNPVTSRAPVRVPKKHMVLHQVVRVAFPAKMSVEGLCRSSCDPACSHLIPAPSLQTKAMNEHCNICYTCPRSKFALGIAESTAKVRNLGNSWGLCSRHCDTICRIATGQALIFSGLTINLSPVWQILRRDKSCSRVCEGDNLRSFPVGLLCRTAIRAPTAGSV